MEGHLPSNLLILIVDKEYTFQESVRFLARAISLIDAKDEKAIFSVADVFCLLRSVNEHVPGEFKIKQTHSDDYKILYKSEAEVIERFKERWGGFIE